MKFERKLSGHFDEIVDILADEFNGRGILSVGADGSSRLWDIRAGSSLSSTSSSSSSSSGAAAMAFMCDTSESFACGAIHENNLYLGTQSGDFLSFDFRYCKSVLNRISIPKMETKSRKMMFRDCVYSCDISADGKQMAVTDDNGDLTVVQIPISQTGSGVGSLETSGKLLDISNSRRSPSPHQNICAAVKFSTDSKCLVSGGFDCALQILDGKTLQRLDGFTFDNGPSLDTVDGGSNGQQILNPPFVYSIDRLQERTIATGLGNGCVSVHRISRESSRKLKSGWQKLSAKEWSSQLFQVHSYAISKVILRSPNLLYSCSLDGSVSVFNLSSNSQSMKMNFRDLAGADPRLQLSSLQEFKGKLFVSTSKNEIHQFAIL